MRRIAPWLTFFVLLTLAVPAVAQDSKRNAFEILKLKEQVLALEQTVVGLQKQLQTLSTLPTALAKSDARIVALEQQVAALGNLPSRVTTLEQAQANMIGFTNQAGTYVITNGVSRLEIGPTRFKVQTANLDLLSSGVATIQSSLVMDLKGSLLKLNGGAQPLGLHVHHPHAPAGQAPPHQGSPTVLVP